MSSQDKTGPAKVVITKNDHGVSIRVQDSNLQTKYLPVDGVKVDKALSTDKNRVVIKPK